MKPAETDPHVSCPIVCGEYMRATGFFFTANNQTCLITARHNVLPTNTTELETGDFPLSYRTHDRLPTIDIYLRNESTFDVKRVQALEGQGIFTVDRIDAIGIPINFDPRQYGYIVWTHDDIVNPDVSSTLDIIGYSSCSFSESNHYDPDSYTREITNPYVLSVLNDSHVRSQAPSDMGLLGIGIDTDSGKSDVDYEGYSGSPVQGDGLAGIHCANFTTTAVNPNTTETTETSAIAFWRAEALESVFAGN